MDAVPSLHPTDQTLNAYGLGKLDDPTADSVHAHLERCDDCRKRVAEMSADSFLGKVRDAQAGPSLFGETPGDKGPVVPPPPPADTLPPGLADHPDYEIKQELGRGGMGVVYLAHNKLMGRDEVLKVMSRKIIEKPGVLDRFLREIRAVAKLRHANIVTAYSAFRLGESIVFAMEYVPGLDLSRLVKARGPLPVAHACNFVYQVALGLQHACEEGLVHRDIKPSNLMLARRAEKPVIKVLDFGLAKVTREETVDNGLTSVGQALGTPDFIAPEQILDAQSADIRADIYSLGGTLYYLLTGHPPFKANSLYDMYQAHISRDADPLNFVRPEVPAELASLVAKMMAKDAGRRFQAPGEVAQALTPFFKKANATYPPEASEAGRPKGGAVSTPTQPATDPLGLVGSSRKTTEPAVAEAQAKSRSESPETVPATGPEPAVASDRRRPRAFWPITIAASLFGLIALGGHRHHDQER
jgi:serine/threonine protein kinase